MIVLKKHVQRCQNMYDSAVWLYAWSIEQKQTNDYNFMIDFDVRSYERFNQ